MQQQIAEPVNLEWAGKAGEILPRLLTPPPSCKMFKYVQKHTAITTEVNYHLLIGNFLTYTPISNNNVCVFNIKVDSSQLSAIS